jgi:uncharacterized protein
MRLALDSDARIHLLRSYGDGELVIGNEHIRRPCLVSPERLVLDWNVGSFAELSEAPTESGSALAEPLEALLQFGALIVLLGSGTSQPLPSARLRTVFRAHSIALECMNLGAACRTYNILASEQRSVVAGLFP